MGHAAHVPYYAYKNEYQAARGQWTFYYDGVPEEVPRLASGAVDYSHLLLLFIFLNLLFCTIYGVYMSSLLPSMNWPGIPHVNEWAMLFAVKEYPIMPGEQDTWVHEFYIGTYLNFIKTGYVISVERITLMIYNVHLLISTQHTWYILRSMYSKLFWSLRFYLFLWSVPDIPEELGYDLVWPLFTPNRPSVQVIDKYPRIASRLVDKDEELFWNSLGLWKY